MDPNPSHEWQLPTPSRTLGRGSTDCSFQDFELGGPTTDMKAHGGQCATSASGPKLPSGDHGANDRFAPHFGRRAQPGRGPKADAATALDDLIASPSRSFTPDLRFPRAVRAAQNFADRQEFHWIETRHGGDDPFKLEIGVSLPRSRRFVVKPTKPPPT